jgi:CheY-like chemotaxis protein
MEETSMPVEILLVEDNPGDVLLMEEALREGKLYNNLYVARNGDEALDFLYKRGNFRDAARPDLIMLDLNLPKKDGREVLAEVKRDPDLKKIPIVIITTSKSEEDIDKTYSMHANAYVTKPVGVREFFKVVQEIEDFWFSIVKLPTKNEK